MWTVPLNWVQKFRTRTVCGRLLIWMFWGAAALVASQSLCKIHNIYSKWFSAVHIHITVADDHNVNCLHHGAKKHIALKHKKQTPPIPAILQQTYFPHIWLHCTSYVRTGLTVWISDPVNSVLLGGAASGDFILRWLVATSGHLPALPSVYFYCTENSWN